MLPLFFPKISLEFTPWSIFGKKRGNIGQIGRSLPPSKIDPPRSRENDRTVLTKIGNALKEWDIIRDRKVIDGNREYLYAGLKKLEED